MLLNSREFQFLKNYIICRNIYGTQNAKRYETRNTEREARDENVRSKRADFFLLLLKNDLFSDL